LAAVLIEANPGILAENNLKAADFKGIAKAAISIYAPGKRNDNLRKHSRNMAEMAWDYASEIVHSPNRNIPDAKICLLFTCTMVSILQNLYLKYLGFDTEEKCPECKSMDVAMNEIENDILIMLCKECGHEKVVKKIEKSASV